ncbi:polyadenylate-binding protein, cytoplasmic and nuclear-like isoform X2 [Phalaenopsis equestris]|uniref:polyadenylate-binding protein, cytoplasmic and nuclear-like isoform X2 n=1 Tax=Phalaenopsis equestris TaxID=78828 RepID=UPI0009E4F0EB|nr:polyadenylate-binding protein, cytoplasmic and nuclear-like isoform X2 [Phalaenopsis equestris]
MALRSTPSPSSVIGLRRYLQIHPLRAVFFHRAHFSTSLKNFGSTSVDRNGSVPRISHVCPSADHSCTEEMSPSSSRIFVKGLSRSTSEGCLLKQFSQFGEISKVKIVTSRGAKESLGMAYVWFACTESAELAIKEMNVF